MISVESNISTWITYDGRNDQLDFRWVRAHQQYYTNKQISAKSKSKVRLRMERKRFTRGMRIQRESRTLLRNASADWATHGMSPMATVRPTMRCNKFLPCQRRRRVMLIWGSQKYIAESMNRTAYATRSSKQKILMKEKHSKTCYIARWQQAKSRLLPQIVPLTP